MKERNRITCLGAICTLSWLGACQSADLDRGSGGREPGATAVQALIGLADYRDLEFVRTESGNAANTAAVDLSNMAVLGVAGQYAIGGETVEFGVDGGLIVSWASDRGRAPAGAGTPEVELDRSLVLPELFLGGYASAPLGDLLRVYAGGGPNLVIAHAEYDDELMSADDTAVGFGAYARAGLEFRLPDDNLLGFGARWVTHDIDFDDPIGEVDVEGWQFFLTFTHGM